MSWVPQPSVLKHPAVALFVSLSDWKDVFQSLLAGVPILSRPLSGEQRMVARIVRYNWSARVNFDGLIHQWWFLRSIDAIIGG